MTMYTELHLHTNFSLLEGASHAEELVVKAEQYGYTTLAITDHDNLYGAMPFADACKRHNIRPIIGMEITHTAISGGDARHHLTLLAESRTGYANLCRLSSLAHGHSEETMKAKEIRRRDPWISPEMLREHTQGLICLTGCRQGEISQLITEKKPDAATSVLQTLIYWFGKENVYLELMDNAVRNDKFRNRRLVQLAEQHGVSVVATGDVHYHVRARHKLQDALVAIHHRTTLDASHHLRRPNNCFHLRTPGEQVERFAEWPQAVAATQEIAERCSFDITANLGYRLPSPPVSKGQTVAGELRALCLARLHHKYPADEKLAALERLEQELKLIEQNNLSGFFLIYYEVMKLAEEVAVELRSGKPRANSNLPPGRGRGSSVSSIVCYLIGLSHIDPIRNKLFIGRFLNNEMRGLPDIDMDFPRDIRARLFERIYEKWGSDHAAIIGLFPTYRIRSAVRDLGKVLALPPRQIDRLAKIAEGYGSAQDVELEMKRSPQFKDLVDVPAWRHLIELAQELAGFPRHLSQHVGGVVISSDPLIDIVPIEPAAWPGRYVCQWDKDAIDDAGMVKIDCLGLGMLSLVEECVDLISEQKNLNVDLSRIDFNDKRLYDRICKGDTIGVFQIESRAQAGMLPLTQPRNLEELAAQVAIVRPGPIVGGALHGYIDGRAQQRAKPNGPIPVPHESIRHIVEETLGVILYQEQVVQVAMVMGGFSPGEAESFRRAMGRRDWHLHEPEYRNRFMTGAARQHIPPGTADKVFQALLGFAEFGFPKSHAVAFGLLAYQSMWLKEYFPAEFYCALYNQWPMGFYAPHVITNDAQRHDVAINRPDINRSRNACTVEQQSVRVGLKYVDGIDSHLGSIIESARDRGGPFRSLFDFVQRTGIKREVLEHLIRVGAFDGFGLNRRELIWQAGLLGERMPARSQKPTQMHLELSTQQDQVRLHDFNAWQKMAGDYELLSLSPDAHPLGLLRPALSRKIKTAEQLRSDDWIGEKVLVSGLVVCRQQPMTASGTVFLALEDETGLINLTIPPRLYEKQREIVRGAHLLSSWALMESLAGDVPMLRALSVEPLQVNELLPAIPSHSWM